MDPMTHFLTEPRARTAFSLRVVMDPPFGIDVRDEAALTIVVPVRGEVWLVTATDGATLLQPGQAATVRGPQPYLVADDADRAATVVIGPDQSCQTLSGDHLDISLRQGVYTWGDGDPGETVLLIGTYQSEAAVGRLVTTVLPPVAVFSEQEADPALIRLLARELGAPGLAADSALDRLLDLLLLQLVRSWSVRIAARVPSWVVGVADPVVSDALEVMHADPGAPWTVAELARRAHVSRATFAARFRAVVGQPPMAYLAEWRLALAADRLAAGGATLAQIAGEVGYGSPFTLSSAFSKAYGVSPAVYRRGRTAHVADESRQPGRL
jgi:AraC-like DNA-binding protein